ncbi:hypothetical protein FKW77_001911 [Venturia effusa]|uniref:Uncharacterized protein n=1 Tax=Venturia effusa TaxID=50376 RepID=A0A517L2S0_9PEZI|nr:hypothetical protein FKW77_001911 [Venturia effusa]
MKPVVQGAENVIMSSKSTNLLALSPRKKSATIQPKNRDIEQLLLRLNQTALGLEQHSPQSKPIKLPPNPQPSRPASFLSLSSKLRRRIFFLSAKCDWLRLLNGEMFRYGNVHHSYFKWLPERFHEWEWVMRQVDHAGRLERDVDFVVEAWWRGLHETVEERKAREVRGRIN